MEAVETLGMWLEEFHPLSVVELDYGGLMGLLVAQGALGAEERVDGIVLDCSVRYVADGLAALAQGDDTGVTAAYLRYRAKWDAVRRARAGRTERGSALVTIRGLPHRRTPCEDHPTDGFPASDPRVESGHGG